MKNIFEKQKLEQLIALFSRSPRVAVISHTNPDGDAIGSGLALTLFLRSIGGSDVRFFVPNHFPEFLRFVDADNDVEVFGEMCKEGEAFLAAADLIFIVDFNQTSRLERMSAALERNIHAPRVLIDHHIAPPKYDLEFWTTQSCSTAYLIQNLITYWAGTEAITPEIASALYLGIMTDTGCFSFSHLEPDLFRAVATLVERGANPVTIHQAVYDNQSQDRLKMVGYLMSEKMKVYPDKGAAYITLTHDEKERFHHQIGDTEGVVNMPLTIKGISFSAILIETKECIKLSLRSVGSLDVNVIANAHFNGGGHINAAGGKFFGTMEQAACEIQKVIDQL